MSQIINRSVQVPAGSSMKADAYATFLKTAYGLISGCPQYMGGGEDINSLELAHLYPPELNGVCPQTLGRRSVARVQCSS